MIATGKTLRFEAGQLRLATFIVWCIVSGVMLVALVFPFLFSAESIGAFVPECEWKAHYNKECPLCGMTRGFVRISQGRFKEAHMANRFAVWLYSFFLLNEFAIIFFLKRKAVRRWTASKRALYYAAAGRTC